MRCGDDADANAERKGPRRTGGMTRGEPGDDGTFAVARQPANDVQRTWVAIGLVASPHLAEHQRPGPPENAGQAKLRQQAIETIRPLVDVFEKQHASGWRIERVGRAE